MRACLVGRAQQSGADVRVVGDGAADRLSLDGGQDLVGTGLEHDRVGSGVHVSDSVRVLDGGDIPGQVELVGGVPLLIDGRMCDRRELGTVAAGCQSNSRGLGVGAHLLTAGVAGEPGRQFAVVSEARKAGCNVEHRAADDLDGSGIRANNLIDERFTDVHDPSHSSTPASLPFLRAECPWFRA